MFPNIKQSFPFHANLQEDLESTRRNYETQLSTLTEHIADMNEKLIQRQDCIEALKRQVESKVSIDHFNFAENQEPWGYLKAKELLWNARICAVLELLFLSSFCDFSANCQYWFKSEALAIWMQHWREGQGLSLRIFFKKTPKLLCNEQRRNLYYTFPANAHLE